MRAEHTISEMDPKAVYPMLISCVIPRPIAWVSTVAPDGTPNLAPHSLFTIVSDVPPVVQFVSFGQKDTLTNLQASGEFVINVAPTALRDQVNVTGTAYPPGVDEFEAAGVAREPSRAVEPMRAAGAPVAIECTVRDTIQIGERNTIVLGDVVHIALDQAVLAPDGLPDPELFNPASRLGRNQWGDLGEIHAINRIPYAG